MRHRCFSPLVKLYSIGLLFSSIAVHAIAPEKVKHHGPITYGEIGDKIISSHGLVADDEDKDGKCLEVDRAEARRIVFSQFQDHGTFSSESHDERVYSALRNVIKDLELFYAHDDSSPANNLFSRINYTSTLMGEAVFAKMVASFSADLPSLKKRRAFIELLLNNQDLFDKLEAVIDQVRQKEAAALSFWHDDGPTTKNFIKSLYYDVSLRVNLKEHLNRSTVALEVGAHLEAFLKIWPLFADIARNIAVYKFVTWAVPELTLEGQFGALRHALSLSHNPVANYTKARQALAGKYDHHFVHIGITDQEMRRKFGKVASFYYSEAVVNAVLNTINKGIDLKNLVRYFKMNKGTLKSLQTRLIGMAQIVASARDVKKLAQEWPAIIELVTYGAHEKTLDRKTQDADVRQLFELLKSPTFKGEPSYFAQTGNILAAYKLMQENKEVMVPLLEFLGEVDACLSIVRLLKKYEKERVRFALVNYVEDGAPYLKLEGFWNPMLPMQSAVTNTLTLGGRETVARNVVLTGSNTGGKSTILKGIIFNALLAQTLCISAADYVEIRPFAYLGSSLNIVDNIAGGKSLFLAEVDRAVGLVESSEWFAEHAGASLLIIDELFRGTTPDRAQEQTYVFAQRFAVCPMTSYILATHFVHQVTQLEQETGGICKNYKIEVKRDEQGNLKRTFKLVEGVNGSNIAADILDNAFKK